MLGPAGRRRERERLREIGGGSSNKGERGRRKVEEKRGRFEKRRTN